MLQFIGLPPPNVFFKKILAHLNGASLFQYLKSACKKKLKRGCVGLQKNHGCLVSGLAKYRLKSSGRNTKNGLRLKLWKNIFIRNSLNRAAPRIGRLSASRISLPKKADRMKTAIYSTQRLRCIRRLIFAWTHSQSAKSPIQTLGWASLKWTGRLKCCAGKGFNTYYAN